jgi:hypothetical protein
MVHFGVKLMAGIRFFDFLQGMFSFVKLGVPFADFWEVFPRFRV